MIKLAAIGSIIIAVMALVLWNLGDSLAKTKGDLKQTRADLTTCQASYAHAAKVTRQWSEKYNTDTQALKDETAKLYADQQVRSQASCKAQYRAGVLYGSRIGSAAPERLRGPDDDFRHLWLGTAGAN